MGIWTRRDRSQRESSSAITVDRKVVRFRRLVEQHGELLDLFADLKDKQSGEYILDRRYIEAGLDRAYEEVRRILYDMHVITGSDSAEGYDRLDILCAASERILRDASQGAHGQGGNSGDEAPDWETLALQALFQDLTRLSSYGSGAGPETPPAAPESVTEWAGWAHLTAAQWLTDNLPRFSPPPAAYLWDGQTEAFCVQVSLLGSLGQAEASLRQCMAREHSVHTDAPFLSPFLYLLEGLRFQAEGRGERSVCLADARKEKAGRSASQMELYLGEDFLLLRLPPSLPLRLLWCSLSVQPSENLIYLYGAPRPPLFERLAPEPFSSEQEPFPARRCGIAGRWMYWASRFSWAQGEERLRMLGHSLAGATTVGRDQATRQDTDKRLQEGMIAFLEETALPQKEVNPWKSL